MPSSSNPSLPAPTALAMVISRGDLATEDVIAFCFGSFKGLVRCLVKRETARLVGLKRDQLYYTDQSRKQKGRVLMGMK